MKYGAIALIVMALLGLLNLALKPNYGDCTPLWVRLSMAVHRQPWPVDGRFVLNGLRSDSTPVEVERWAYDWDRSVAQGEVALNRNADGSPSLIMRNLRVRGDERDGKAKGVTMSEMLELRCDNAGHPLSARLWFTLVDGGQGFILDVDARTGAITGRQGSLSNLNVQQTTSGK